MNWKRFIMQKVALGIFIAAMVFLWASPGMAIDFCLGGKRGPLMGDIKQTVQFGIAGDKFATQDGFQSALFSMLLEARLPLNDHLKFFN